MVLLLLVFLATHPFSPVSAEDNPEIPAILARAESLFQSMKSRDYAAIFAGLSAKSQETIVAETVAALAGPSEPAATREATPSGANPAAPPGETGIRRENRPAGASMPLTSGKNTPPDRNTVRNDFLAGGPIARDYWDAFLRRFDPDEPLEHSRWEMGPLKKDRAEVLLTRHGADHPARLMMYRENGAWKAGLVETFWSR
ncbi:MAG: hypothetical protein OHK0028_12670 [Deltaproteobacteria bacterium]